MNIKKLEIKEYKNKGEICKLIGVKKASGGRNIKLQDEEFSRYFKWEKTTGYKIKITEIYDIPLEKVDNRGKNENSHKHSTTSYEELEYILLDYINHNKNNTIYISNNILSSKVLTNNNYYFAMKNEKDFNIYLKKKNKLSNNTITKDLFRNINTSAKGIIQTCFKNLNKKYNLNYSYNYILIELDVDNEGNIIDKTREAEEKEVEIIDKTTKQYIKKFNKEHDQKIKNLNDVCYLKEKLYNKFYMELDTEIFEALYNNDGTEIKMYFKGYIIKKLNNIGKVLKDINIEEVAEKLNKKFIKNSISNITRQIEKKKEIINQYIDDRIEKTNILGVINDKVRYKIGKNKFGYRNMLMLKNKYKEEYINILNFILDINEKDITFQIEKTKRIIFNV